MVSEYGLILENPLLSLVSLPLSDHISGVSTIFELIPSLIATCTTFADFLLATSLTILQPKVPLLAYWCSHSLLVAPSDRLRANLPKSNEITIFRHSYVVSSISSWIQLIQRVGCAPFSLFLSHCQNWDDRQCDMCICMYLCILVLYSIPVILNILFYCFRFWVQISSPGYAPLQDILILVFASGLPIII